MVKNKIPRSYVQSDILSHLLTSEKSTFTELKKLTGVSNPTLSIHLSELHEKKLIKFIKKGRFKYYSIIVTPKSKLEKQIITILTHYKIDLITELEERKKPVTLKTEYKNIGNWLGSYFLFLILQSFKTGENWTTAFTTNHFIFIVSNYLMSLLVNMETQKLSEFDKFSKEINDKLFQDMNKIIKNKKLQGNLDMMSKSLEDTYPKIFDSINFSMYWANSID